MRAVLQRVSSASVSVAGKVVGQIDAGIVAFVGIRKGDGQAEAETIARKMYQLRILEDERSAQDVGAPLLVISQFTLYADTAKGRRPSWNAAAKASEAQPLVESVVAALRQLGATVATGVFGANMQVSLVNNGPFTLIVEA